MQILYGLLALILLPIALLLILLGLVWAVNGVIYLITFIIVGAVLGLIDFSDNKRSFEDFWGNTVVMSGMLALLPIVVLCINTMSSEITIPSNTASWSCGFYALNWFAFVSGSLYAINTCLVLMLMKIINKFFVGFIKDLEWGLAYLITILQITIAGFVIKSAIAQDDFSNSHLYLATIPILELSLLFVFIIGIYKIIKVLTAKSPSDSLYLRGDDLYKNKRYNEALNYYEQAYNADVSTADYYFYAKGNVHYAQKDYEEALSCLNNALPKIKNNVKKEYLVLIETVQKEYADLIAKTKQESTKKVNQLYDESLKCKKWKNYKQALDHITKAIKIAEQEKLDTSKLFKLKDELTNYVNNTYIAENDFQSALKAYKNKDYVLAINNLVNATTRIPDNKKYQAKLKNIKDEYKTVLPKAEDFYKKAENYLKTNSFDDAVTEINNALKLNNDNKYVKLKNDIKSKQLEFQKKQLKLQNEQEAEKLYSEAKNLYNSNSTNFDKIFDVLNKAIALSPKKTYKDMFAKVKKESDFITAERLYEEAKECLNNKYFDKGLSLIKQAIKLNPSNKMYIDLKQKIDWEQKEAEKNEKADEYFKEGVQAFQDGEFADAIEWFKEVMYLQPNNAECKALLDKAKTGKMDITTCTKNALLTLDFINAEQAENIILARNNGEMWYDYQKFAEQFEIMPHLWADIEEKIEFPLKQANKYGRRLDW